MSILRRISQNEEINFYMTLKFHQAAAAYTA